MSNDDIKSIDLSAPYKGPILIPSPGEGKAINILYTSADGRLLYYKIVDEEKRPCLTTEDGIKIFDGDTYYEINLQEFSIKGQIAEGGYRYPEYYEEKGMMHPKYKFFAAKEKADEYLFMNKPCLSYNDIFKFTDKAVFDTCQLKKFVKSKL